MFIPYDSCQLMRLQKALLAEIRDHLPLSERMLILWLHIHRKTALENANGLLACPFRLADNNAKSNDSGSNECDCGKWHC